MFKIEDVPRLPAKPGRAEMWPWPFDDMKPGQSFFIPLEGASRETVRVRVAVAFGRWQKRTGRRDVVKEMRAEGEGFRFWLVPSREARQNAS